MMKAVGLSTHELCCQPNLGKRITERKNGLPGALQRDLSIFNLLESL
jgi:hypothetical protein